MEEEPEIWEPLLKYIRLHPNYCSLFIETTENIFYGDYGSIPVTDRHFIAIMAASRHACQYLIELHSQEFLRLGGDPAWLAGGLPSVPPKLRQLDVLNRILAHQPWTLAENDLAELIQVPSPENWSLSELMLGAVIINHVHSLCSFIFGCGDVSSQPPSPVAPPDEEGMERNEVALLMQRMEQLKQSAEERTQEEKAKHFAAVNIESSILVPNSVSGAPTISSSSAQFTSDPDFQYVDFVQRINPADAPTFKIHDYAWEDEGYSLVSQLYSHLSSYLDSKFSLTKELTYNTMGEHKGVDTTKYRIAIWNYIQSLYGIRHDDYDYAEVNHLVSRSMKSFIKMVCCYPSRVTDKMRSGIMVDFLHSEKVHVLLMILEARLQSELLYFLRCVSRFLTKSS